jgi:hypothetical protein
VVRATRGDDEVVQLVVRRRGQVASGCGSPSEYGQRYAGTTVGLDTRAGEHLSHCSVGDAAEIRSGHPEQFLKQLAEHRMNNACLQRVALTAPLFRPAKIEFPQPVAGSDGQRRRGRTGEERAGPATRKGYDLELRSGRWQ